MRPARRFAAVSAVALFVLGAFGLLGATPVRAHTEVQRAVPGPGETVDTGVDGVVLQFAEPVVPDVSIEVRGAEGEPVPGLREARTSDDGLRAQVSFDPLTEEGDYVVEYSWVAEDGDAQRDTYRFSVAADAGVPTVGLVLGGAALLVLAGALVLAVRRRGATA